MILHSDLAAWIRRAARSREVTQWGRAVCLMVAEEISSSGCAEHLRSAKALLERVHVGEVRPRDVHSAQEILDQISSGDAPWSD